MVSIQLYVNRIELGTPIRLREGYTYNVFRHVILPSTPWLADNFPKNVGIKFEECGENGWADIPLAMESKTRIKPDLGVFLVTVSPAAAGPSNPFPGLVSPP